MVWSSPFSIDFLLSRPDPPKVNINSYSTSSTIPLYQYADHMKYWKNYYLPYHMQHLQSLTAPKPGKYF